jgi:hypothetical protein
LKKELSNNETLTVLAQIQSSDGFPDHLETLGEENAD